MKVNQLTSYTKVSTTCSCFSTLSVKIKRTIIAFKFIAKAVNQTRNNASQISVNSQLLCNCRVAVGTAFKPGSMQYKLQRDLFSLTLVMVTHSTEWITVLEELDFIKCKTQHQMTTPIPEKTVFSLQLFRLNPGPVLPTTS